MKKNHKKGRKTSAFLSQKNGAVARILEGTSSGRT